MVSKNTALANRDKMTSFMTTMRDRIAAVLPKHLTPERMAQIVLVEASRTPKLVECTTSSLAASVMLASELGLEPSGPLGKMYLIPRRNKGVMECTTLIGYKGLADLARRSGEVARLNAGVVYQWEIDSGVFRATLEPPEIRHAWSPIPEEERTDDKIALAYATALLRDGSPVQVVLSRADIDARMARSASGAKGPWGTDKPAMARKSALRALLSGGLVPLSAETPLARALEAEAADNIAPEPTPVATPAPKTDLLDLVTPEPPAEEAEYVEPEKTADTGMAALLARMTTEFQGDVGASNECLRAAWGKCPDLPCQDTGETLTAEQVAVLAAAVDTELGA